MPRMIFVSLPVRDLAASRRFYEGLGFSVNENFSDETTACVVVSETIYVMIQNHERYAGFAGLPVGDPREQSQHLLALTCDSREEVDELGRRAVAHGGTEVHGPEDLGFMYSIAFTDPDGHAWGPLWMDPAAAASGPPEHAA